MLNLSKIKEMLDKVITHIDDSIEINGMEGNYEYCEMLNEEVEAFRKVREVLSEYQNKDLSHQMFLKSMRDIAPSFNIDNFISYVETIICLDKEKITEAQEQLEKDMKVKQFLENSKVDAWI